MAKPICPICNSKMEYQYTGDTQEIYQCPKCDYIKTKPWRPKR